MCPAVRSKLPTEPRQLCSSCCSSPLAAVSHHPILMSLQLLIPFICPCPLLFGVNHAVICVWWVVFLICMCVYIYIYPASLLKEIQTVWRQQDWCSDIQPFCIHVLFQTALYSLDAILVTTAFRARFYWLPCCVICPESRSITKHTLASHPEERQCYVQC